MARMAPRFLAILTGRNMLAMTQRTTPAHLCPGGCLTTSRCRKRRGDTRARATETFPNEREAKKFARAKLVETQKVSAGTINPHLPKRTIAPAQMLEWLEEPDEDDLA